MKHYCNFIELYIDIFYLSYDITISIATLINMLANCAWGAYESWSTCSMDCAGGTQTRTRSVETQAQNGGTQCSGGTTETRDCNEDISCNYYSYYY